MLRMAKFTNITTYPLDHISYSLNSPSTRVMLSPHFATPVRLAMILFDSVTLFGHVSHLPFTMS